MPYKPIAWTSHIKEGRNGLYLSVIARTRKGMLETARINEQGETDYNSLLISMCGYSIDLDETYTDRKWWGFAKPSGKGNRARREAVFWKSLTVFSKADKKIILRKYPDFRYVLKKMLMIYQCGWIYECKVFYTLIEWLKNPAMTETLLSLKCTDLIGNRNFLRMKPSLQKAYLKHLRESEDGANLDEWLTMRKYKLSYEEVRRYKCLRSSYHYYYSKWINMKDFKYLNKKNITENEDLRLWGDMLKMAERLGHDINDPYWRYPKDIEERHDQLMQIIDEERYRREMEYKEKHKIERQKFIKKFYAEGKKWRKCKVEAEGYDIFVPVEPYEVERQAKCLNQCLIACGYDKRMSNGECLLVFLRRKGEPMATAEINQQGKTVQFRRDQKNYAESQATDDMKKALDKWYERANELRMFTEKRRQKKAA